MQSDRHLLLGLLALQCGFISKDQLVAAFSAWTSDKQRPIEAILGEQKALTPHQLAVLKLLEQEVLAQHRQSAEQSLAALSSIGSVRQELEGLADPQLNATLAHVAKTPEDTSAFEVKGSGRETRREGALRYRTIRLHAKGGLGEVFVAQDEELNREVALKEIQERYADSDESRARFKLEAEITGNLEHPGIVPVYGLGQYADGRPYYAMRFIRGDSLKEAIDQFHAKYQDRLIDGEAGFELRKLLRRFVDVCNAMAYAHSRGVLHRDLKPGNIILGRYGETLVVDWGLAKAQGQGESTDASIGPVTPSSGSGATPTMVGSAVGTPAYMSPEQAAGKINELGPTTDVYALGATLFHLLTGQLPIAGKTPIEVVQKAEKGEIRRPKDLRAEVPKSLEAVCLKAMAKEPVQRYASPVALADDVEKWLADEPVSAFVEPFSIRARRWIRRHPAIVSTLAACVVLVLCAALIVAYLQGAHAKELAGKNQTLASQNQTITNQKGDLEKKNSELTLARNKAEVREQEAIDAVKRFGDAVAGNPELKNSEKLKSLRKELLKEPLSFFRSLRERLQKEESTRPDALERLAQAASDLGRLTNEIGDKQDALTAVEQSKSIFDRLVRENPNVYRFDYFRADSYHDVATLLHQIGKPAEALSAYEEAIKIRERLARDNSAESQNACDLASTYRNLGSLHQTSGRFDEAFQCYTEAIKILKRRALENPNEARIASGLALSHNNLGNLLRQIGKAAEALTAYAEAKQIQVKLANENPNVTEFASGLADTYINLGVLYYNLGQPSEALVAYEDAIKVRKRLALENPSATDFASGLATCYLNFGNVLFQTGKNDEALAAFKQATEIQERLARENPTVTEFSTLLAISYSNLGVMLYETGKPAETVAAFKEATRIQERLVRENPTMPNLASDLGGSHFNLGKLLNETGKPAEAIFAFEEAIKIQEKLTREHTTVVQYASELVNSYDNLGKALYETGKRAESLEAYVKGKRIGERLTRENPAVPEFASSFALSLSCLAQFELDSEAFSEAKDLLLEAILHQKRALTAISQNPNYRMYLKDCYRKLNIAAQGLNDSELELQAKKGLVEVAAGDPQFAALDSRLARVKGGEAARDTAELLAFGQRAYDLRRFAQATRFFVEGLEREPALTENRKKQVAYNAACSAALAGCGEGFDELPPDEAARVKLRGQALAWLRGELEAWKKFLVAATPEQRAVVAQTMKHWQSDADLTGVRNEAAFAKLPETEQIEWQALWKQVGELLAKAKGPIQTIENGSK